MSWLLALVVLAPLVAAGAAPWTGTRGGALAALAATPALACALLLETAQLDAQWLLLGVRLELDGIGRPLLGAFGLLWLLAAVYGHASVAQRRGGFWCFWGLSAAGTFGVAVAGDLVTFYLSFALLTFAAYGLVVHARDRRALYAGRVYIVFALVSEAALLAGFLLVASEADTIMLAEVPEGVAASPNRTAIVVLLIAGFGVKTGLLGLHAWLPLAHPVAPAAASAVLSGAMVKAGLLGWLRFLPLGEAELRTAGLVLVVLGLAGAFGAVVAGLAQRELKTVLAYSTVSQMGVMTALVGVAAAAPAARELALTSVLVYAVHHGLAKGALFVGAGIAGSGGTRERRLITAGMAFAALVVAGAPLTGGQVAKEGAKELLDAGPAAWGGPLEWLLQLSAAATAALVAHATLLVRAAGDGEAPVPDRGTWVPWALLLGAVLVAPWGLEPLLGLEVVGPSLAPVSLWESLWPLAVGLGALAAVRRYAGGLRLPPGDVVVPLAAAGAWTSRSLVGAGDLLEERARALQGRVRPPGDVPGAMARLDDLLTRWSTGAALLVAVAAAIVAVIL
jgi:formate hydrogenlyase subunit 3/multisubunit Na+/H+ antiporter MnhD subunit